MHPSTRTLNPIPTGAENRFFKSWCSSLRSEEFHNPDQGMERFTEVLGKKIVHHDHRFAFMSLWFSTAAKAEKGTIEKPAAVFIKNLKTALGGGQWRCTDSDEDAARAFLVDWDRKHRGTVNPLVDELAHAFADDTEVPVDE